MAPALLITIMARKSGVIVMPTTARKWLRPAGGASSSSASRGARPAAAAGRPASDGDRQRVHGHVPARAGGVVGAVGQAEREPGDVLAGPAERRAERPDPGERLTARPPHDGETCVAVTTIARAATTYQ